MTRLSDTFFLSQMGRDLTRLTILCLSQMTMDMTMSSDTLYVTNDQGYDKANR